MYRVNDIIEVRDYGYFKIVGIADNELQVKPCYRTYDHYRVHDFVVTVELKDFQDEIKVIEESNQDDN